MDKLEIQGTELRSIWLETPRRSFRSPRRQHLRVSAPDFAPLEAIKEKDY